MTKRRSLAALAAVLTASACAPLSERTPADFLALSPAAVSDYQRGKDDLGAGNYGLALIHFRAAIQRNPNNIAALNGEAITLAKLGRDEEAGEAFERALKRDVVADMTIANYATFLERHGEHAKAAALLAKRDVPVPPPGAAPAEPSVAMVVSAPAAAEPAPEIAAAAPTAAPVAPVVAAPLAAPVAPVAAAVTTTAPKSALTISNASGQYRLARRLQQYLTGHGIAADRVANAPRFDRTQSVLFCHAQSRQAAEAIQRALPPTVKLVVLLSNANSIELVAGSDLNTFDAKLALAAPQTTGAVR